VYIHCRISEQYQNHKRLSEQLLESQAAIGKPEQATRRELLEGFSQLVSDFLEVSRNYILENFHKKTAKNSENHQRSFTKYCYCFDLQDLKKWSSRDIIPLKATFL
jgi:hypothetical protein